MIQVNRIYLIFNRLVTKKFLVDTSDLFLRIFNIMRKMKNNHPHISSNMTLFIKLLSLYN